MVFDETVEYFTNSTPYSWVKTPFLSVATVPSKIMVGDMYLGRLNLTTSNGVSYSQVVRLDSSGVWYVSYDEGIEIFTESISIIEVLTCNSSSSTTTTSTTASTTSTTPENETDENENNSEGEDISPLDLNTDLSLLVDIAKSALSGGKGILGGLGFTFGSLKSIGGGGGFFSSWGGIFGGFRGGGGIFKSITGSFPSFGATPSFFNGFLSIKKRGGDNDGGNTGGDNSNISSINLENLTPVQKKSIVQAVFPCGLLITLLVLKKY